MVITLKQIRDKVRLLTGRPDVSQIEDYTLNLYINDFYINTLTAELNARTFDGWYQFYTTPGARSYYPVPQYRTLNAPAYIDGHELVWYTNPEKFYQDFPQSAELNPTRPTAVLFYGNVLTFRQPPDGVYFVKICGKVKPPSLEKDTDEPLKMEHGRVLAYGAAIEILMDNGEEEAIARLQPAYQYYLNLAKRHQWEDLQDYTSDRRF